MKKRCLVGFFVLSSAVVCGVLYAPDELVHTLDDEVSIRRAEHSSYPPVRTSAWNHGSIRDRSWRIDFSARAAQRYARLRRGHSVPSLVARSQEQGEPAGQYLHAEGQQERLLFEKRFRLELERRVTTLSDLEAEERALRIDNTHYWGVKMCCVRDHRLALEERLRRDSIARKEAHACVHEQERQQVWFDSFANQIAVAHTSKEVSKLGRNFDQRCEGWYAEGAQRLLGQACQRFSDLLYDECNAHCSDRGFDASSLLKAIQRRPVRLLTKEGREKIVRLLQEKVTSSRMMTPAGRCSLSRMRVRQAASAIPRCASIALNRVMLHEGVSQVSRSRIDTATTGSSASFPGLRRFASGVPKRSATPVLWRH